MAFRVTRPNLHPRKAKAGNASGLRVPLLVAPCTKNCLKAKLIRNFALGSGAALALTNKGPALQQLRFQKRTNKPMPESKANARVGVRA